MSKKVAFFVGCAATALSLTGMIAADAMAQERSRRGRDSAPAEPAAPSVSREFATAYQPINTAINAADIPTAEAGMAALRAAATSPYELYLVAQTGFRIASAKRDPAAQREALQGMVDSGGMPAAQLPTSLVALGQLEYNARNYAAAAQRIEQAMTAGATNADLDVLRLDALYRSGQTEAGNAYATSVIEAARAAGRAPSDQIYGVYAVALQEADNNALLASTLVQRTNDYPTAGNFRAATLAILNSADEDKSRTTDLLRLMLAADAMNDRRFYLEYVGNVAEDALPAEALAVIAAGRRAGMIPAGDSTFNEIEIGQNNKLADDRASLPGAERRAIASPDARLAQLVADAYYGYGNFAKAEELYTAALSKNGANTDLLNTRIGIARFGAGNFTGAIEAFDRVSTTGTRSNTARLWTALARSRVTPAAAPAEAAAETPPATPAS